MKGPKTGDLSSPRHEAGNFVLTMRVPPTARMAAVDTPGRLTGGKTLARSPMTARRPRRVADNAGFKQVYEAGRLGGDTITRRAPPCREPRTRARCLSRPTASL